jgi:hypothetical protein
MTSPKELIEDIIEVMQANLVPMIAGSPGIGKSDIIRQIAAKFKLFVIDMRLSQCDPTDMLGFPIHNGIRMGYAPPENFPLEGMDEPPKGYRGWLLFLDEFPSATQAVQAAAYKLVLDRQVGKHNLHDKCRVICAGNKSTDNAIVNRMGTAMQSRLIHLELDVDVIGWLDWAQRNDLDHRVISYIESHPDELHKFKPDHDDKTFACPRTWEFTSKLIKDKEPGPRTLNLLIGTLSAGIGNSFNAYIRYYSEMPSIEDIKRNPETIEIPEEPAMLYATSHMVAAYLTEKTADQIMPYIKRLPLEFGTTATRAALKRKPELLKVPVIRAWSHVVAEELFEIAS